MAVLKIDVGLRQKQLNLLTDMLSDLTREVHGLALAVEHQQLVIGAKVSPAKPRKPANSGPVDETIGI